MDKLNVKNYASMLLDDGNVDNLFKFLKDFVSEFKEIKNRELEMLFTGYYSLKRDSNSGIISYEHLRVEKAKIILYIREWIEDNLTEDFVWNTQKYANRKEDVIKLSVSDLKKQLREIMVLNGINVVYFYLKEIVSELEVTRKLIERKKVIDRLEWKLSNWRIKDIERDVKKIDDVLEEEKKERERISAQKSAENEEILKIIESLKESDFVNNWKRKFFQLKHRYEPNESYEPRKVLISPLDIIQIPMHIRRNDDYQQYKRLMIQAQDAYLVGDYSEAYNFCIKVRNEVDPESAQLYEYLFVTYYNKVGAREIIEEALKDFKEEKHLKLLFLYASRFVRLQSIMSNLVWEDKNNLKKEESYILKKRGGNKIAKEVEEVNSITGEENIKKVNSNLLLTLASKYTEIVSNIPKYDLELSSEVREKIFQCILIAKSITEHIRVDALFATTVINEIVGGGRNQWIVINEYGELENTDPRFNAIGHFYDSMRLFTYGSSEKEKDFKEKFAGELLNSLREKYDHIKNILDSQEVSSKLLVLLVKVLVSFRVVNELFPGTEGLLDVPILELSSSEESLMNWYILKENKNLESIDTSSYPYYFDAINFYKYFLAEKHFSSSPYDWSEEKDKLIDNCYIRLSQESDLKYFQVNKNKSVLLRDAELESIRKVVSAYKGWKICFQTKRETVFLEKCYQELIGDENYFWFLFNDSIGLSGFPVSKKFGIEFYPLSELQYLIDNSKGFTFESAYRDILLNYFHDFILPRVKEIQILTKNSRRFSLSYQLEVFNFFEQIFTLFSVLKEIPIEVGHFLYSEIIEESTFIWLDIQDDGTVCNHSQVVPDMNIEPMLKELIERLAYFDLAKIFTTVIENRKMDLYYEYRTSFSRVQKHNYYEGDILRMVEILEALINFYRLTGDVSYLYIPYVELVKGKGKVKWAKFGIEINGFKPFRYSIGAIKPRYLIKMIGLFDFPKTRVYVKTEYEKRKSNNETNSGEQWLHAMPVKIF